MYLRCYNSITIIQQPTPANKGRNKTISLDFLHQYEITTTWDTLTDTAKVIIPKNVPAKDAQGNEISLAGSNKVLGFGSDALFMRGDRIAIYAGYYYRDAQDTEKQYVKLLFQGYVTKVHSGLTVTLECQDSMWLLKQIPAPNGVWGKGKSFQSLLQDWINKSDVAKAAGITVNTQSQSTIEYENGTFFTKNQTIAQVVDELKRKLGMPCYMKDTQLRIWYPIYYPEDVQTPEGTNQPHYVFDKNINIITDNLQYQRKDDIVLSAIATSSYSQKIEQTTKDGQPKTRNRPLKVYVYSDRLTQAIKSMVITDDSQIPENTEGQRFDWTFYDAKTTGELIKRATDMLQQSYYTGFRGSFTTFGMPYIPYGDNIIIRDKALPDRDGTYKVKSVKYTGGIGIGIRQEITLHYKIEV